MKTIAIAAALLAASFCAHAHHSEDGVSFALAGEATLTFDEWRYYEEPLLPVTDPWVGSVSVPTLDVSHDGTFLDLAWSMSSNIHDAIGVQGYATILDGQVIAFGATDFAALAWQGLSVALDVRWIGGGTWNGSATLTHDVSRAVVSAVPEPATWAALAIGLVGIAAMRRARRAFAIGAVAVSLAACGGGDEPLDPIDEDQRPCILGDGRNVPEACK